MYASTTLPEAPGASFAVAAVLVVSVLAGAVVEIVVALAGTDAVRVGRALEVVLTPVHDAEASGIEFLANGTLGNALSIAEVVTRIACTVSNRVVALMACYALRVCRAYEVSVAPIVDTVAAGIQFFAHSTHGDALPILVSVSSFARFTHVVADSYFLVRARTVGLAGGTSFEWN